MVSPNNWDPLDIEGLIDKNIYHLQSIRIRKTSWDRFFDENGVSLYLVWLLVGFSFE
jgi:hypothetical protein